LQKKKKEKEKKEEEKKKKMMMMMIIIIATHPSADHVQCDLKAERDWTKVTFPTGGRWKRATVEISSLFGSGQSCPLFLPSIAVIIL
jgi:hypothetical protein